MAIGRKSGPSCVFSRTFTAFIIKTPRQDLQKNVALAGVRDGYLTPRELHLAIQNGAMLVIVEYRQTITTKLAQVVKVTGIGNKQPR